jgi:anti-sigma regulatory factor (Ser/Thr protein kinase)
VAETIGRHVHEALFFTSQHELQTESAPFLREGLESGGDAVLACTEVHNEALSHALGDDERVIRLARREIYRKPVTALESIRDFLGARVEAGTSQVRVVCEVDYGSTARSWDDWCRFEAVVNHVLTDFPLWTLCAYDVPHLPGVVLDAGLITHPIVRRSGRRGENPDYRDPAEVLRRPPLDVPSPTRAPDVDEPDVGDLRRLARRLREVLLAGDMDDGAVDDVLLALNEVVTNGLRHGVPPVSVRAWLTPEALVCAVTDRGPGIDDPFVGYLPGNGDALPEGQFGLWLARRLCDEVDTLHTPDGFTVRLVVYR